MRKALESLRTTFHIDGYYEGILDFDELKEFIDLLDLTAPRAAPEA